jgi:ubiquinone/menaquinone biosynthesis C-methylase UbiE
MTLKWHIAKWDKAAKTLDKTAVGVERRYGKYKRELFGKATGRVLLVAAGTGGDFSSFPDGLNVTAVDFSQAMLDKAKEKAAKYNGVASLVRGDVQQLGFRDGTFDTIVTSCTFCSVPNPAGGLAELRRVLKWDGRLLMFEHVRAGNPALGLMMDIMTPVSRIFGPDLNRKTGETVKKAGFEITREFNVYLDIVKIFEARKL